MGLERVFSSSSASGLRFEEAIQLRKNGDTSGPEHFPLMGAASGASVLLSMRIGRLESADSGLSIARELLGAHGRFR